MVVRMGLLAVAIALGAGVSTPAIAREVLEVEGSDAETPFDLRPILPVRATVLAVDGTDVLLGFDGVEETEIYAVSDLEATVLEPGMIVFELDDELYLDVARTPIVYPDVVIVAEEPVTEPAFPVVPRPEPTPPVRALW